MTEIENSCIVIFGASGDLTHRKLVPALYNLFRKGRLAPETRIVGVARRPYDDEKFRALILEGVREFSATSFASDVWEAFVPSLFYKQTDLSTPDDYAALRDYLVQLENGPANRLYYLSAAPSFYPVVIE